MGQLFKDMDNAMIRNLIPYSIKGIDQKILTKEQLKEWKEEYGHMNWQTAMKKIGSDLDPRKDMAHEDSSVSGIYITSTDKGKKDNVVDHAIALEDKLIYLKDLGMADLDWGGIYNIDLSITKIEDDEGEHVYYGLKKDTTPEKTGQLTEKQVYKRLSQIKKKLADVADGETVVIEIEITHSIYALKDYTDPDNPTEHMMYMNCDEGSGFHMRVGGVEPINEKDSTWITLFFRPQRFGEQLFKNVFPEDWFTEVPPFLKKNDDIKDQLHEWLVPTPSSLKYYAIGRLSIGTNKGYEGSLSMNCIALLMDTEGQLRVLRALAEGVDIAEIPEDNSGDYIDEPEEEEEPEAPEKELKEKVTLKPAPEGFIKQCISVNRDMNLKELNQFLASKGLVATAKKLTAVKKALGIKED